MSEYICPHCGDERSEGIRIPKDVVAVVPCPACHELVVLFRNKVIGVNRALLEHGDKQDRVQHIAEVIEQFLDPDLFSTPPTGFSMDNSGELVAEEDGSDTGPAPISKTEVEDFLRFDLNRIDDSAYFKRHFKN